ncbi:hypothetical protein, partial [Bradyrhizobium sp. SZCCHNRI1029]|uniref:hypothetical protein n=1 Tax=Bradyrhizobium sp. SZCCHNRI1029 TaxID=3057278 RepID=UPI00291653A6
PLRPPGWAHQTARTNSDLDKTWGQGHRLGKDGGLLSAYLPEAAYWALQVDLKNGRLKFIEATFFKRRHGYGDLISLNFSETPPKQP